MSTDRQRLQAAIQRIAKQDPDISKLIGESKNKGGEASSTGIGVSDAERDNLCCDGTTGSGANAGSETRDPDDGGEDGLNDDDPADLSMGQGSLTGVTDCATGEPICFDGSEFIPPENWDDPLVPPEDTTWCPDCTWRVSPTVTGCSGSFGSANKAIECALSKRDNGCEIVTIGEGCCGTGYSIAWSSGNEPGICDLNGWGISSVEEENTHPKEPLETEWPEDGCANLAIYGGKIVGSKFDPENDGSYSAPRDELEVCDSSGNRILLRGSPTGGWKSIKSLSGDIDPDTGNGYLYRPSGKRVRQISPSEFRDDTV